MYVTDSLFFLQHLYTTEDDEYHGAILSRKFRDIMQVLDGDEVSEQDLKEQAESIMDKMVAKSEEMTRSE